MRWLVVGGATGGFWRRAKESDDFRIDDLDTADDVIDLSRDKDEVPTLLESVSD